MTLARMLVLLAPLALSACTLLGDKEDDDEDDDDDEESAEEADADTDADTDSDTDSDTDADTDSDTDSDTDADTDSDTDSDTDADTVTAIQDGTIPTGSAVVLEGLVVSSPNTGEGFFASELDGGEYGSVWVYYGVTNDYTYVQQGDLVDLSGQVEEYFDMTQIKVSGATDLTVVGSGSPPSAQVMGVGTLLDAGTAEPWEGGLVTVRNLTVTEPDASADEFEVDDGLTIDDLFVTTTVDEDGTFDEITGIVVEVSGVYKLAPRDASDLVGYEAPDCGADRCADELGAGDLIITEIMINPAAGDDTGNEWVELYNATSGTVNLNGLTLEDFDGYTHDITDDVVVSSGGYVVLGAGDGSTWAYSFTPSHWWGSDLALGNNGDQLFVEYDDSGTVTVIDASAEWSTGKSGKSWSLDRTTLSATSNDSTANWCSATSTIGGSTDQGTPGAQNDICP